MYWLYSVIEMALYRHLATHTRHSPGRQSYASSSHLSASKLSCVPAWITTWQCFLCSAISVVIIWCVAVSSFTRSRHLNFDLPRFRFPYTVRWPHFYPAFAYMAKPSQQLLSDEVCYRDSTLILCFCQQCNAT